MIVGFLMMVMFIRLVANTDVVLASNPMPAEPAASFIQENQTNEQLASQANPVAHDASPAVECSLGGQVPESIRRWCGPMEQYASVSGLPVNLVAALITQESNGDPDAYSHSGAVGLMQIMPRDGIASSFMCVNGPCFSDRPSINELYDPDFNLAYGTKMLAGLIQKHGNLRDALKAYGPMDRGYEYADKVLRIYESYEF
jgi:soluble lytic murein transglycosylase-like protein